MTAQREWFEKDYYAVLGVSNGSTAKEITKKYRKLARVLHPDASSGNEERFKEVSAAYDVLGDSDKRREYDEVRKLGQAGAGFAGGRSGGPEGFQIRFEDLDDSASFSDLFGGLFGRRGRTPGPAGAPRSIRGVDQEAELHLGFMEAVDGVTTTVNLFSDVPSADGYERRHREVKVRIPAGVDEGQRIRLRGKGGPGRNGGPAGDLFVVVHVKAHERFGRDGRHLTINVPVTFPEAALGANVKVPTLDGGSVTVKIPAGTRSGKTFRVKGKGVTKSKGTGDLLVTTEIVVPQKLSKSERNAIEALAKASDWSPREELGAD